MKPRLALMLVVATAALLSVAFVSHSDAAQTWRSENRQTIPVLRVGTPPLGSTLDQARSSSPILLTSLALEPLMKVDRDGKVRPWLAEKVTQPGPAVYVYHLRKGVKFWDGTELTAEDVANAINYYRFPGSQAAFRLRSIKRVSAKDKYTVVVSLRRRDASFKYVPGLFQFQIFQKKHQQEHKDTFGRPGTLVIGTGPWKIQSFDPTRGAELVANDRYWRGKPKIRRISFKLFSDETSMALAFRGGEIDVSPQISGARAFQATSGQKVISVPSCQIGLFGMNVLDPPWNDVHVRRAVAYALNRKALINANGGFAIPNYTLLPRVVHLAAIASKAEIDKLLKSIPLYEYNLAKAKRELAQSAYPRGFTTTLPSRQFGTYPIVTEAIAAQLGQIGIEVNMRSVSTAQWVAEVVDPAKRPTTFSTAGCATPDPGNYTRLFLGAANAKQGGFNLANYAPAAVENLIDQGLATLGAKKRFEIYSKLLRRLAADVPYVPLWVQNVNAALSSRLTWPTFDSSFVNRPWALEIRRR